MQYAKTNLTQKVRNALENRIHITNLHEEEYDVEYPLTEVRVTFKARPPSPDNGGDLDEGSIFDLIRLAVIDLMDSFSSTFCDEDYEAGHRCLKAISPAGKVRGINRWAVRLLLQMPEGIESGYNFDILSDILRVQCQSQNGSIVVDSIRSTGLWIVK